MDIAGRIERMAPKPQSAAPTDTFRLAAAKPETALPSIEEAVSPQITPMLLAQVARNPAASVAAGAPWPTGGLSSKFRSATPTELWHLAPQGMRLPLEAGFNVVPPTSTGERAAGSLGRMSHLGFGMLATELLKEYVSGKGRDQELSKKDTNKLLGSLMDSSKSMIDSARPFMDANVRQMHDAITSHIARTGETSGSLSGVTDWRTTTDFDFRNSLGSFSGKLLYDVKYSTKDDGSIDVTGNVALAVQDLYDFGNNMLPISIPTWLLPKEFTSRPNHVDEEGSLTDVALAGLQQEGFAKPFYVYGVSDAAKLNMNLGRRLTNSWSVTQ